MIYPELNKKNLTTLYINKNFSIEKISTILGIRPNIVGRKIREFKIKKSPEKIKECISSTNIERYGSPAFVNSEEGKNKIRKTNLERYGVENPFQSKIIQDKVKQTCLEKYGVESIAQDREFRQRTQQTCLKKYGSVTPFGSKEIQERSKNTSRERYNCDYPIQNKDIQEKINQINQEKYGVDKPLQNKNILKKTQQKVKTKYGVDCALLIPKVKEAKKKAYESGIAQEKAFNTKKANNSFTKSKPEDQIYELLLEKFSTEEVIRQYRSTVYPFSCDFYIKPLDFYIEYQGTWKHGTEPFDSTNVKHLEQILSWKSKAEEINFRGQKKKQFISAIKTWTERDPLKRKVAKENNLNWIEFFSIEEAVNYIRKELF